MAVYRAQRSSEKRRIAVFGCSGAPDVRFQRSFAAGFVAVIIYERLYDALSVVPQINLRII